MSQNKALSAMSDDEIGAMIKPLNVELGRRRDMHETAKAKALVGKCFRYRNCYSAGRSWWKYAAVIRVANAGAVACTFEIKDGGAAEVCPDERLWNNSGWTPITRSQFDAAYTRFIAYVRRQKTRP